MKHLLLSGIAAIAGLASAANTSQPLSTWMTDSMIAHGVSKTRKYAESVFYLGAIQVYNATGDVTYFDFVKSQIDGVISSNGTFNEWDNSKKDLDDILVGKPLLFLYDQTKDEKYKNAAAYLYKKLLAQARTESGGFWHKDPAYPNQMWLDGLFMAEPFYAEWTAKFDAANSSAWDDIVLQFDLIEAHCYNNNTGLLVHGYDESKSTVWADPVTGASPHVWNRAVGWYFVALLEVLDWFPKNHPGYNKLVKYFTNLAAGLKKTQDTEGGWWLVMEDPYPGMKGNYIESSGTAMFTYGFLKGIRKGFISAADYQAPAEKAYDLMATKFVAHNGTGGTLNWEGTVVVGSLKGNGSYEYYIEQAIAENDLKGAGPFIYASVEIEK